MKSALKWILTLLLLCLPWLAKASGQASVKEGIPLIVPGSGLGWEIDEVRLVLDVAQAGEYELLLYSPGFDPQDYRSPNELGDERYDQGKGALESVFELREGERVLVRRTYGEEPHSWHRLFKGTLKPGEYTVASSFRGLGKNAVVFALKVHSGEGRLLVDPDSMQTYNVVRGGWQTPFQLRVTEPSRGLRVGVYDGDGPRELDFLVRTPQGEIRPPVPGDKAWTYVKTEAPGRYAFLFRIQPTATQHTNTIGFQIYPGKIRIEIVDPEGRPVPAAGYSILGHYRRTVELAAPPGWKLLKTEVDGGRELEPGRVRFGLGAGRVRFVLAPIQKPPPVEKKGQVVVRSYLSCEPYTEPVPLRLRIGEHELDLDAAGEASLVLPTGDYPVVVAPVPGAVVNAPHSVRVEPDRTAVLGVRLRPQIELALSVTPATGVRGEPVEVHAVARTPAPYRWPAELDVQLPEGWRAQGSTRATGDLGAGKTLELQVEAVPQKAGSHNLSARVSPCSAARALTYRVTEPSPPKLLLTKRADPEVVELGGKVAFTIRVENPEDRPVTVRLVDRPDPQLDLKPFEETFELAPGATRTFAVASYPLAVGEFENWAEVYVAGARVAGPAVARVRVMPNFMAVHESTAFLPFALEGRGDALLVRHRLLEGAEYVPGSSRLDGQPLPDPRTDEKGRLYWRIPYRSAGTLSYDLRHSAPLGPLPEPELSLVVGARALPVRGGVTLEDYERSRPYRREGGVLEPAPGRVVTEEAVDVVVASENPPGVAVNDQPLPAEPVREGDRWVVRVPLAQGKNRITVEADGAKEERVVYRSGRPERIEVRPLRAVADGRTPIEVELALLDANGLPSGEGYLTLTADPEPVSPDADPTRSGYQVRVRDGRARLRLRPMAAPGWVELEATYDDLAVANRFFVKGGARTFYLGQGSICLLYTSPSPRD